ncbi:signal transduction histidine kinase [Streptosporangium album]|uniref:histidine kinase n=1 Tax=Streptosporangium album TaxID=47479 RepID=A0A7W7RV24_9ACTN|nr:HAMP domain-containing sensor histidine kinase [Streptosporangium album]MBB4938725.1 signal transduction histidine kinase [Streptosporangium album]
MNTPKLLPRRITLRARLTLLYGGLFLIAGMVLLGTTYVLFNQQLARSAPKVLTLDKPGPSAAADGEAPRRKILFLSKNDEAITGADAENWMREQQTTLHEAATDSLLALGGIALAVVGGAAAGFGWLVAGRVLAPLHQVTDTARRIAAAPAAGRGLHERIALRGPDDEVKDLADTFDIMVERLDGSFDGQRRFVANASHELRTPLALGRALVELAMHRKSASEDVKQLGESLLEISFRHERLITGLLLLAGSENEITERLPVDLADVVGHVVAQTAPEAGQTGITVHERADEAPTTGDALLLERLVHNLVENGIRHNTGDGGWVRVASRTRHDGRVEVKVDNTGPAVPPYEIPALFEPFRRLGADRLVTAKGAGLGLSIVRAVARAHGGEVAAVGTGGRRPGGDRHPAGRLRRGRVTVFLPPSAPRHRRP